MSEQYKYVVLKNGKRQHMFSMDPFGRYQRWRSGCTPCGLELDEWGGWNTHPEFTVHNAILSGVRLCKVCATMINKQETTQ